MSGRTPLYEEHKKLGAKLVEFAGYEMPVQYEGIKVEHEAVRESAGLFDISHMGEIAFRGPEADLAVQRLVTRDVSRLEAGQAGYCAVCYEDGGTVDDVLVYRIAARDYLIVVNAANREKDAAYFREGTRGLDVEISDESEEWALLALQGPEAIGLLQGLVDTDLSAVRYYRFVEGEVEGVPATLSRTGYTGEDGFEIYLRPDSAPVVWRRLVESGAVPAGLGARDTLRLEAGMPLYGNELSADITPLEAGLSFAVHLGKDPGFIGQEALRREKEKGLRRKVVGFEMTGRGIPRHEYPVAVGGEEVGHVTSGTHSPTLGKALGLALVPLGVEDSFEVMIRDKPVRARVVPLPFYERDG